jgi:hypothetical protein
MSCPICGPLAAAEGPLLKHLLRRHPEAQAIAAIGLPLGTLVLNRQPQRLLRFYLALLVVAVFLSMGPGPSADSASAVRR